MEAHTSYLGFFSSGADLVITKLRKNGDLGKSELLYYYVMKWVSPALIDYSRLYYTNSVSRKNTARLLASSIVVHLPVGLNTCIYLGVFKYCIADIVNL